MTRRAELLWPLLALAPVTLLLAAFFLVPVGVLARISFYDFTPGALMQPGFTLAHYAQFLSDPFYLGKIGLTLRISVIVTAVTLALALPLAYFLVRRRFAGKGLLIGLALSPLLTNFVVLIFAWIVLLGDGGAINKTLMAMGLEQPLRMLYSEPGVVIALVHISLPYALIPLISSVAQVPEDVEQAAHSLGAGPWRAFFFVVLPMTAPGLAAAAFVTVSIVLSGFAFALFVGGDNVLVIPLLIWQQVATTLNWPLAAAMSIVSLLAIVLALGAGLAMARALSRGRRPA